MVAFLLKRQGHNVTILEQAATSEREGLAAGVGFSQYVKQFFEKELELDPTILGVENPYFEILNKDLSVGSKLQIPMRLTSWDTAYYVLRSKFDGLKSSYVPNPQAIVTAGEGTGKYETGKKALKAKYDGQHVTVEVEDVMTSERQQYTGDIVIAADGANSAIRRQMNPTLQREEPGYVIWRGTIPTSELSKETLEKFEGRAIIYPGQYTYCVM